MENRKKQNVLVATGLPKVNDALFGNDDVKRIFNVVEYIDNKNNILRNLEENPDTEILLVSDGLTGVGESLIQIMIDAHLKFPNTRVIYLTNEVTNENSSKRIPQLGYLTRTHIYDIVAETPLTMRSIVKSLVNPATKEDIEWITRAINQQEATSAPQEKIEVHIDENQAHTENRGEMENLSVFSSIKPGTGKSFIATNVATAIARYGKKNEKGEKPKVALIDGDMQNLSIGTLLQVEDEEKNLKTVIDKIHTVLDDEGLEIDDARLVDDARAFIKSAFIPYTHVENLHVLAGSQLQWDKVQNFRDTDFAYLLKTIQNDYDVIIMDSSSSLAHVSTVPMLVMSNKLYYILNLDFNNVRNNSRYNSTLAQFGVQDKVRYVLNESITPDMVQEQGWTESLMFDDEEIRQNGFDLVASIPVIEKTTFLNRIFIGEPVILDDQNHTLNARIAISEIANDIWEVDNLDYLRSRKEKIDKENNGGRRGFFGRK